MISDCILHFGRWFCEKSYRGFIALRMWLLNGGQVNLGDKYTPCPKIAPWCLKWEESATLGLCTEKVEARPLTPPPGSDA